MQALPVVLIEDLRKTYARRDDVRRYLDSRMFVEDQVPA